MIVARCDEWALSLCIEWSTCRASVTVSSPSSVSDADVRSGARCVAKHDGASLLERRVRWRRGGELDGKPWLQLDDARRVAEIPGEAIGVREHPRGLRPEAHGDDLVFSRPADDAHTVVQLRDAFEHGRFEARAQQAAREG